MLRDGDAGLEVFMVKRHHQIDFASGALVFPGGKIAAGDEDPNLAEHLIGADGLSPDQIALRVGAIREAFEEAGLFLARPKGGGAFIGPERLSELHDYRAQLDRGGLPIGALLADQKLDLDLSALVRFAHWITPTFMPKRFDTHFYLAAAPDTQVGAHDGFESVDSVWISPNAALAEADAKRMTIIFPTRMNLKMLAAHQTVADALAAAHARPVVTVLPWVEKRDGKPHLIIPPDAGYGAVEEPLDGALR
jgi:8-oxo-dGTP pyrophosphatase MutT (NUDIX family)